ncbi:MAG TPA: helix-turn-helix transcriptional regulator [Bradyrhizobium sp.]|nr:helix-turn-helix transcriptional regulator [Bradyrhizobium sp.]
MTLPDDSPLEGHARYDASTERSRAASDVASAIAHQLSGPLTALLLYVSDLHLNSDQFPDNNGEGLPLRRIAEQALREAEYACRLLQQIEDTCACAFPEQTDIAHGRRVIAWWSRATTGDARAGDPEAASAANATYQLLTRREREVLRLISQGLTNKEGAVHLQICPRTFESHRARIMQKFKAKNAVELVRMALHINMPADGSEKPWLLPTPTRAESSDGKT